MQKPLLVNGKPFSREPTESPLALQIVAFLDNLPDEVLSLEELRVRSGIGRDTIRYHGRRSQTLKGYTLMTGGREKIWFGNPASIARYRELLNGGK